MSVSEIDLEPKAADLPILPFSQPPVKSPPTDQQAVSTSAPRQQRQDVPGQNDYWVEVCDQPDQLTPYLTDWQHLATIAGDMNAFNEPWMLIPGLEHFPPSGRLQLIFVYCKNKRVTDPPILCGFFPCEQVAGPIPGLNSLRLISHLYSYLDTPLLHRHFGREAFASLLDWARSRRIDVLDFPRVQAEGMFRQAVTDVMFERRMTPFVKESYNRAILLRSLNFETYQEGNIRGHNRRDMNRLRRRLEELGQLRFQILDNPAATDCWISWFLDLEAKGWKGQQGTAIRHDQDHAQFFRQVMHSASQQQQLQMLGLFLNGEPIAMKCNLLTPPGSFAWKIAYDEQYAKFSPGVQLEQFNIQVLHEQTSLQWMDSCAVASHSMINRLWCDRRAIEHLQIPTGRLIGEFYLAIRPLLRWGKKTLLGQPQITKSQS